MRTYKGKERESKSKLKEIAFKSKKWAKEGLMIVMIPMVMATGFTKNVYGDENMGGITTIKGQFAGVTITKTGQEQKELNTQLNRSALQMMKTITNGRDFDITQNEQLMGFVNEQGKISFETIHGLAQNNDDLKEIWGKDYDENMKKFGEIAKKYSEVDVSDLKGQSKESILLSQMLYIATYDLNVNERSSDSNTNKYMTEKFNTFAWYRRNKENKNEVDELDGLILSIHTYTTPGSEIGLDTASPETKEDKDKTPETETTDFGTTESGIFQEGSKEISVNESASVIKRLRDEKMIGSEESTLNLKGKTKSEIQEYRDEIAKTNVKADEEKARDEILRQIDEVLDLLEKDNDVYYPPELVRKTKITGGVELTYGGSTQFEQFKGLTLFGSGTIGIETGGVIGEKTEKTFKENTNFYLSLTGGLISEINPNWYTKFYVTGSITSDLGIDNIKDPSFTLGGGASVIHMTKKGLENEFGGNYNHSTDLEGNYIHQTSFFYGLTKDGKGVVARGYVEKHKDGRFFLGGSTTIHLPKNFDVTFGGKANIDEEQNYTLNAEAGWTPFGGPVRLYAGVERVQSQEVPEVSKK